jgi:hypothetical protein
MPAADFDGAAPATAQKKCKANITKKMQGQ